MAGLLDDVEFGREFGGELGHGGLGGGDRIGRTVGLHELIDLLAGGGELGAEALLHGVGLLGELGFVAHAFGGLDDFVEVVERLRVGMVPIVDFLVEVAHARAFAASGLVRPERAAAM